MAIWNKPRGLGHNGGALDGRMRHGSRFIPLPDHREYPLSEMFAKAGEFADDLHRRRPKRGFVYRIWDSTKIDRDAVREDN